MSLPDRNSVAPADLMAYALIDWQPSQLVRCPTCHESGLAGYSAHKLVALACQKCGPIALPAGLGQ
jgi:hypothetical protein